jgi:Tfp pilus assembly protein PilV
MKQRLYSSSGMTLIEVILALSFLLIISVGFTLLLTFTGKTVNYAGHDSVAIADAHSAVNILLASPIDPSAGESVDISIYWGRNTADIEQDLQVIRDKVEVKLEKQSDESVSNMRLYRNPAPDEPSIEESAPQNYFTVYIGDANGGYDPRPVVNRGNGVPYSEIINVDQVEILIEGHGRMPDCWKIIDMKYVYEQVALDYGPDKVISHGPALAINYAYKVGKTWNTETENIYEETFVLPIYHGEGKACDC